MFTISVLGRGDVAVSSVEEIRGVVMTEVLVDGMGVKLVSMVLTFDVNKTLSVTVSIGNIIEDTTSEAVIIDDVDGINIVSLGTTTGMELESSKFVNVVGI